MPQADQSSHRVGEAAEADTAGLQALQGAEAEEAGRKFPQPVPVDVFFAGGVGLRAMAEQQYL